MEVRDIVGLAGVPIIVALVEVLKVWLPDVRLYAPAALGLGLLLNLVAALALGTDVATGLLYGLVAGLAASGLYSQGRAALGK